MLHELRKKDKKGYFVDSYLSIGYPTGFLPLDYRNGYVVNVFDENDNITERYNNLGIFAGTYNTIYGDSGVAKTTAAVQFAANIVRNIENAIIIHLDLEQSSNYSRIKILTRFSKKELEEKYLLKQTDAYIEDVFAMVMQIAQIKEENREKYLMDIGLKDEFGRKIYSYAPTVMIVDSLPRLDIKPDSKKGMLVDEMEGATYRTRVTKHLSQLLSSMGMVIRKYNIIMFLINHTRDKVEMNQFDKSKKQLLHSSGNKKYLPCGTSAIYYSNNHLEFITGDVYTEEKDGFDGFLVNCTLTKSRTNKTGKTCQLICNLETGFDPVVTLMTYIKNANLIGGKNPTSYFKTNPDVKFDTRIIQNEILRIPNLYEIMKYASTPELEKLLAKSRKEFEEEKMLDTEKLKELEEYKDVV